MTAASGTRIHAHTSKNGQARGRGCRTPDAHKPQRRHSRSIRVADSPTLPCPPRALHNTRTPAHLQNQTAQSAWVFEPNEMHGYTRGWASCTWQTRARGTGTLGVTGAGALRALVLESARANRAGRVHLYQSSSLSRTKSPHSEAQREQHLHRAHVNDQCRGGRGGWPW